MQVLVLVPVLGQALSETAVQAHDMRVGHQLHGPARSTSSQGTTEATDNAAFKTSIGCSSGGKQVPGVGQAPSAEAAFHAREMGANLQLRSPSRTTSSQGTTEATENAAFLRTVAQAREMGVDLQPPSPTRSRLPVNFQPPQSIFAWQTGCSNEEQMQHSWKWYRTQEIRDAISDMQASFNEGKNSWFKVANILQRPGLAVQASWHSKEGSLKVQKALEVFTKEDAVVVALQFKGHIVQTSQSKHGNHAVKKMIEVLPPHEIGFIINELQRRPDLACNVYACRVCIKLIRKSSNNPAVWNFVDSVLQWNTLLMAIDEFGHYFAETVLEHGARHQRNRQLIDVLKSNFSVLMQAEKGPYVIAKLLQFGEREDVVFVVSCLRELNCDTVVQVVQALPQRTICEEVASLRQLVEEVTSLRWLFHPMYRQA